MTEYIYIVKCDGCEDEIFNFFTDARMQCDLVMSKHPIIQQIEIERNDFGECTDSTDLGTVWSWEEVMDKETDAEPAASVFTKDDLKNLPVDNDPEFDDDDFYFMNNSIAEDYSRRVSFKSKAEHDEFMRLCSEIGIITGEDLDRFMVDHKADDSNLLDKLRAYRAELGDDFKLKEARKPAMGDVTPKHPVMTATRAPKDSDYVIVLKHPKTNKHYVFSRSFTLTSDLNKAMPYSSRFEAEDDIKYAEDAIDQRGFNFAQPEYLGYDSYDYGRVRFARTNPENYYDDYRSANFFVTTAAEAKQLSGIKDTSHPQDSLRKPIPEGMTIEQLVEEMEENEDTVECTWCNDLFDKSECRREVDLGWLCSRCEMAIKSRGEPLTFRENDYWDFLDEGADKPLSEGFNPNDKVALEYDKLTITVAGNQRDVDDWDEAKHTDSYTYEVSKTEVADAIWENFLTDEDVADVPGGIEALEDNTEWHKFLETNFDKLFEEYYDEVLEYFRERATKEFERTYSWDDYKADLRDEFTFDESVENSHLDILEEDAEYSKRLTACPECGNGSYDHETGFCINCGFN
jgi:hypothetical protein